MHGPLNVKCLHTLLRKLLLVSVCCDISHIKFGHRFQYVFKHVPYQMALFPPSSTILLYQVTRVTKSLRIKLGLLYHGKKAEK